MYGRKNPKVKRLVSIPVRLLSDLFFFQSATFFRTGRFFQTETAVALQMISTRLLTDIINNGETVSRPMVSCKRGKRENGTPEHRDAHPRKIAGKTGDCEECCRKNSMRIESTGFYTDLQETSDRTRRAVRTA